jgi:hypothetical protein
VLTDSTVNAVRGSITDRYGFMAFATTAVMLFVSVNAELSPAMPVPGIASIKFGGGLVFILLGALSMIDEHTNVHLNRLGEIWGEVLGRSA